MALPDEQLFFITNRPEAVESVNMGMPMLLGASAGKAAKGIRSARNFLCRSKIEPSRFRLTRRANTDAMPDRRPRVAPIVGGSKSRPDAAQCAA